MQLISYLKLMRFHKPIGTLLLLWPTTMSLKLTGANFKTWLLFTVGVVVMRAAGCVINDFADRNFDGHVRRTAERPLAQGSIGRYQSILLFFILLLTALFLALQLQKSTLYLSVIAALLAVVYPFCKRFFIWPQLILGIAFAWSILMVYVEVLGVISAQAWILFTATVAWVIAYDTQYAMADRADDLMLGLNSTAIAFGSYDKLIILLLQLIALTLYAYLGANLFFIMAALVAALYQQLLLHRMENSSFIRAFMNNNYFGMLVFFGFLFC